MVMTWSGAG